MSTQVVLTSPDELVERANRWALLTQRDLAQTLADALQLLLTPLQHQPTEQVGITNLSDREVLALTSAKMKTEQGRRLSRLLTKQREERLTPTDQSKLVALMETYDRMWLRQSEALAEAVRRGLRKPLSDQ